MQNLERFSPPKQIWETVQDLTIEYVPGFEVDDVFLKTHFYWNANLVQ